MQTEDIKTLTPLLAATLKKDLEWRGEGARVLQLALFRVDGAVCRIVIGTSRPLREPSLIGRLFQEKLTAVESDIDAGYGFELVRLSALAVAHFDMQQTDLDGDVGHTGEALAIFADRVRARLGEQALMKPVPVESHIPERSIIMVPFAEASGKGDLAKGRQVAPADLSRPERPFRLFRHPEPVEVAAAEIPEGPPIYFRWRRVIHKVTRSEGPERIAPEWWLEGKDAPTRDYFRVEDGDGRRYWLYRQGLYGASQDTPRWFMHGIFA